MKHKLMLALGVTALAACVETPDDALGTDEAAIHGSGATDASQFQLDRALTNSGCTATRIAPTFALTALHCGTNETSTVVFYHDGPGRDMSLTATVADWIQKPGIDIDACHDDSECYDQNGVFADVALLQLTDLTPSIDGAIGAQATLAWAYPGDDVAGTAVGSGKHNDEENPSRVLRQIIDTTDDSDADDGSFHTDDDIVNSQDSGGPFYVQQRELGVAHAHGWDGWYGSFTQYTSVPRHLDWILGKIGYAWPGAPSLTSMVYQGTLLQSVVTTERGCQYACEHTATCEAYNYNVPVSSCGLYTAVNGWHLQSQWRGAIHFGAATGKSGTVVAYRRGDGYSAVLHKGNDSSIHELYNAGSQWSWGSIAALAGQPIASKLSGYKRGDGINAIVYRSLPGHIIEVALVPGVGWQPADLTATYAAPNAVGDPTAYVRADGVSAIVYRTSSGHVIELRQGTNAWIVTDLTAVSGVGSTATGDPTPFVRADGLSSVVFLTSTVVVELFKAPGHEWSFGFPSLVTVNGAAPAAYGGSRPYAWTHRNGVAAIVYRSATSHLIELRLETTGWRFEDLTGTAPLLGGNPVGYVRTDGIDSVVYRSSGAQLIEVTRAPLQSWNLSVQYGIPALTSDPAVYQRIDGYNAIVYQLASNHVGELSWNAGDSAWGRNDLTFSAGEQP